LPRMVGSASAIDIAALVTKRRTEFVCALVIGA
jgi:hypothetical protein